MVAGVAVLARHPLALEQTAGGGTAAGTAGVTMHLLHAVRGPLAGEVVPLHDAGEAAALAGAGHIDRGDFGQNVDA